MLGNLLNNHCTLYVVVATTALFYEVGTNVSAACFIGLALRRSYRNVAAVQAKFLGTGTTVGARSMRCPGGTNPLSTFSLKYKEPAYCKPIVLYDPHHFTQVDPILCSNLAVSNILLIALRSPQSRSHCPFTASKSGANKQQEK